MTTQLLDLTGLVDHWGGSVATGLTLVARARSGSKDAVRSANGSVTFSSVLIARYSATTGVWSPPLALEALAAGCYWELRAVEDSTRDSLFRTVQFPDTRPVIEWADLVDIDPATTVPIVPTPPSAAELLAEAETLLAEAQALVAGLAGGGAGGFLSGQYPNPGVNVSALDAAITSRIQDDGTDGSESATHAAVKALAAALIAAQAASLSATYLTYDGTNILKGGSPVPIAGAGNNPAFQYTQTPAAAQWTITHSFGRRPDVDVYLTTGEHVITDVSASTTQVVVTFPTPTAGYAVLT